MDSVNGSLLILMPDREDDAGLLAANLREMVAGLEVRIWPELGDPADVRMVVSWRHPPGALGRFPNLDVVASFGAGVEHILVDKGLPSGVRIVRTVDESLVRDMVEYVLLAVVTWRRRWESFQLNQAKGLWAPQSYPAQTSVLVLGAGRLGGAVSKALIDLGHRVASWSRTGSESQGARCLEVEGALCEALPHAEGVICLLPLSSETEGILSRPMFERMKEGSLLVNVARGRHLVEEDLLDALKRGRPAHAVLDVFREEPLPAAHSFWTHPKITVTPHVAALTDPKEAARRVAENWRRLSEGEDLLDVVDVERGY
ncbi:MAG: glyoxylate/hydroxypyruvate reductase A [Thermoanaerobaculales bacterium]|nr:glyoxylate/hydroxypyruvate reductase A [Thermoanaerobaculales bacterium]